MYASRDAFEKPAPYVILFETVDGDLHTMKPNIVRHTVGETVLEVPITQIWDLQAVHVFSLEHEVACFKRNRYQMIHGDTFRFQHTRGFDDLRMFTFTVTSLFDEEFRKSARIADILMSIVFSSIIFWMVYLLLYMTRG